MRSGVLGDLWYGNGSTLAGAAWVGWRTWHFSRDFNTPGETFRHFDSRTLHGLVSLPYCWTDRGLGAAAAPRTEPNISKLAGGGWRHWLRFEGVQSNVTTTLNGKTLGNHIGQFDPFECLLRWTGCSHPQINLHWILYHLDWWSRSQLDGAGTT
eukprot:COSAG02_NODE_3696_length_6372_cov_2.297306_6_plen_154_part_00